MEPRVRERARSHSARFVPQTRPTFVIARWKAVIVDLGIAAKIYAGGAFRMRNELRDTSEQAIKVGLNKVGTGSCLNASLPISVIGRAGIEKNRRVRVEVAHPAAQFKAIEIGQPHVEQIQVEAFCLNQGQGFGCSSDGPSVNPPEL